MRGTLFIECSVPSDLVFVNLPVARILGMVTELSRAGDVDGIFCYSQPAGFIP